MSTAPKERYPKYKGQQTTDNDNGTPTKLLTIPLASANIVGVTTNLIQCIFALFTNANPHVKN